MSWIRTNDLPILKRVYCVNERIKRLYGIGCADHCTTTAFSGYKDILFRVHKGWWKE